MSKVTSRNLTLRLDSSLYRAIKVIAAQRDTSISGLVSEKLAELVREASAFERAKSTAMAYLDRGLDLGTGGSIEWTREESHER